jgi:putative endonuclease
MSISDRGKAAKQSALDKGALAEALVAQWLTQQGWTILEKRWTCRMGEIDLIAYRSPAPKTPANLVFVEVKARSSGNWDADGLLAITAQKQLKLWRSAQLYLAKHPAYADLPCSFDVALVHCRRSRPSDTALSSSVELGKGQTIAGHCLTLTQYLPAAFDR